MRLPHYVLEAADPRYARTVVSGNPGQFFDIGLAGPLRLSACPGSRMVPRGLWMCRHFPL